MTSHVFTMIAAAPILFIFLAWRVYLALRGGNNSGAAILGAALPTYLLVAGLFLTGVCAAVVATLGAVTMLVGGWVPIIRDTDWSEQVTGSRR